MEVSLFGLATATAAGAISFLSPCVLPLVPGYLSFVSGDAGCSPRASNRWRVLTLAASFVTGFTTVFVLLGLGSQALGGWLQHYREEANLVGGALVIAFGLSTMGLLRLPWLLGTYRWRGPDIVRSPVGAYTLGLAFAFGWTPCIGPVLGSILVVSVSSAASGAILLGAYGLGLGIPFLLTAMFFGAGAASLGRLRQMGRVLNLLAGVILVAMGILMISGQIHLIAGYLLETFPILGRLG